MKRFVVLVLAAATVVAGILYARTTRSRGIMHDLQRAQPYRVFAPRLSVDMEYRECGVDSLYADSLVQREVCDEPRDTHRAVDRLAAAAQSLHPDSLRASAVAALIWWGESPDQLHAAIERLSAARALTRDPVPVLVDLSAAHLVRADRTQNPYDVWQGLEYALEAVEYEPNNLPALFNAALAAEALPLREVAVERWNLYLDADSTSPWANEARDRRDSLLTADSLLPHPTASSTLAEMQAFARQQRQAARELGWETALPEWGKAVREDRIARADSMLAWAEGLGAALDSLRGDASLSDAVRVIHAARDNPAMLRTLAHAHHAYGMGDSLFRAGQYQAAHDSFELVMELRPDSPALLGWAQASFAATLRSLQRGDDAKQLLEPLLQTADSARHPAMVARMRWALAGALPDTVLSRRALFRQAAQTFARLEEWEFYAGTWYREGWTAYGGGDARSAFQIYSEALRAARPYRSSTQLHRVLLQAAQLARTDGMHRVAMLVQHEDNKVAARVSNPMDFAQALMASARMYALADSIGQAVRDLTAAEPVIAQAPDTLQSKYLQAVRQYSRVLLASHGDTSYATELDSAVSYYQREEETEWLLTVLVSRAELRLAANDLCGADADLDSLMAGIRRPSRADVHLKAVLLERMRSSHDRLVMGYVRDRQPLRALEVLERNRLSFASGTIGRAAPEDLALPPAGRVVLEYALIGDTLLTWVIRRDSITLREQWLNAGELRRTITSANVALEAHSRLDAATPHLQRLYNALILPVRGRIPSWAGQDGETELAIVADGEIAGIPFAALLDETRYLVEDHPIRVAATLADAAQDVDAAPVDGPVLLVANPAFDLHENAPLGRLPGAVAEVDAIKALYGPARRLADTGATVPAFRDSARGARVIHYAGHAVFDASRPERSFLLLAGAGPAGRLMADSVNTMQLDSVRLVVLSACRTVRGHQGRSGGFAGLTGAMLSAGADGVVASLWLVSDTLAKPLMVDFHREYSRTRDAARALRTAQLNMIRSGSPQRASPAAWAGFRYMGR